jgi:hypothetical protein
MDFRIPRTSPFQQIQLVSLHATLVIDTHPHHGWADKTDDGQEPAYKDNQEARLENALKARNMAEEAERALVAITGKQNATANDIANAEAKVRLARLQANQAYREAGLPELYFGVLP